MSREDAYYQFYKNAPGDGDGDGIMFGKMIPGASGKIIVEKKCDDILGEATSVTLIGLGWGTAGSYVPQLVQNKCGGCNQYNTIIEKGQIDINSAMEVNNTT